MGELESEILGRLWAATGALTPGEVVDSMKAPPAYTTVMTILTRLWRKGIVEREPRGRAFAYRPLLTEAEFAAQKMRLTLEGTSNRMAALSHFVGSLSKKEERSLRRIIEQMDS